MPCDCPHPDAPVFGLTCPHLLASGPASYREHFTGAGKESWLSCPECRQSSAPSARVCRACWGGVRKRGWDGIVGAPSVVERPSALRFVTETRRLTARDGPGFLALRPVAGRDAQHWVGLDEAGAIHALDLHEDRSTIAGTAAGLDVVRFGSGDLRVSDDGRFAAVFNPDGPNGAVVDLSTGRVTMRLDRGTYHIDQCHYPVAFFVHRGRSLLVHASEWNRLEVSDPATGGLLTARVASINDKGRSEHYLDYFHCGLSISPDGRWLADDGWAWSPIAAVRVWSLGRWMDENVWESEDGPTARELCVRERWDAPLCWIDGDRLAVWGYGDEGWTIPGVRVFAMPSGEETHWFPVAGRGELECDDWLMSMQDEGTDLFDPETGERVLSEPGFRPGAYHPGTKTFLSWHDGDATISRLVGHPAPPRLSADARNVAEAIAAGRDWAALPVLADALEDGGCDDARILTHLRQGVPHGRDCWAIRRLLGR